jgi:hypothetical protein
LCGQRLRHYVSDAGVMLAFTGDLNFGDEETDVNGLLPHIDIVQRQQK